MGDLGSPGWEGEEWRMLSPTERTRFDSMWLRLPAGCAALARVGAASGGEAQRCAQGLGRRRCSYFVAQIAAALFIGSS